MAGRPPRHNRVDQNENENPPSPPRVNLSREDMLAITTILAATLQGMVNPIANAIQPPPEPQPRGIRYNYESLRKNRVPIFYENPDPEVSHNWLKNVESQLHLLEVLEGLKVEVVTPFLEERARKWWETVSPLLAKAKQITWQTFRREFLKQYYPAEFRLQKLIQFENFKQTPDMTVMEYTSRFNDLGTYIPTIMSDETLKMHRFKKVLNSRIQSALAVFRPNNFADFMGATMSTETDIKRRDEEIRTKDCWSINLLRMVPNSKDQTIQEVPQEELLTVLAILKESGAILVDRNTLENVTGKLALVSDVVSKPNENKTNARVYAITHEEADNTNEVVAELIQLNMIKFDIILGMDWLAKNHAIVDCQEKNVKLQTPTKEEIIYHGKSKERKSFLSVSQAWKAIKRGEEIYLAVINEIKEEELPKLEDIPIVQEFPYVFSEELLGEIPDSEVEFEINLVPAAAPISKAPCRMALAELKELKEQLQELLDKKQILPSASPYHGSNEMAPYEALYGRKCRSPLYWDEVGEKAITGPELVQITIDKVAIIKEDSRQLKIDKKAGHI
ncbi:uncharacterized protein LOC142554628 [Primulina tabacum]|uniref:uncharacterized protein LOC142554628 n=1 Tax=Primulina tabacum TaxID=48773 RepID=UPI003F5A8D49